MKANEDFPDEFVVFSAEGRSRNFYLDLLLADGWTPAGETDDWDLEKPGNRVVMATERGEGQATTTLVRVWGPEIAEVRDLLQRPTGIAGERTTS